MAIDIKHKFQSNKPDAVDATLIRPSNWNDSHEINMDGARLLGRYTAGIGPAQEITLGNGLQFVGGALSTTIGDAALKDASNIDPATWRTKLALGTAATRNVGTTSGTVAAGDDARITGAMPRTGGTFSGQVIMQSPLQLTSTGNTTYGYVGFHRLDGTRGAYLGYGNGSTVLNLALEAVSTFALSGGNMTIGGQEVIHRGNLPTSIMSTVAAQGSGVVGTYSVLQMPGVSGGTFPRDSTSPGTNLRYASFDDRYSGVGTVPGTWRLMSHDLASGGDSRKGLFLRIA